MFKANTLIKHNFFGYGIVLDTNEKTSDVFFIDGKRTIMNTHLTQVNKEKEQKRL